MSMGLKETEDLTQEVSRGLNKTDIENTDVVLCPSFTALKSVSEIIKKNKLPIFLGAQNVFWQEKGAYTGEISPLMLKELGVKYIIIGHSERRVNLKETDEMINKKIEIALAYNLIPILCVGEMFEERQRGEKDSVINKQIAGAFKGINFNIDNNLIIAYEPVWAISSSGYGQIVEPPEAEDTSLVIKQQLIDIFGSEKVTKRVKIIYGGNVDSSNVKGFLEKNVEGFLVGGASLKLQEFIKIITILSEN